MPTIYFNQRKLIISSSQEKGKNFPISLSHNENKINNYLMALESVTSDEEIILTTDETETLHIIASHYTEINAAGGIVENTEGEFLFIFRREKWDLPKGKMDEGETALEAAVREIEEETGVNGLDLINQLPVSYHVYEAFGKKILKKTYWFHFRTSYSGKLVPQIEEDITQIDWINPSRFYIVKQNTYPAILDILSVLKLY